MMVSSCFQVGAPVDVAQTFQITGIGYLPLFWAPLFFQLIFSPADETNCEGRSVYLLCWDGGNLPGLTHNSNPSCTHEPTPPRPTKAAEKCPVSQDKIREGCWEQDLSLGYDSEGREEGEFLSDKEEGKGQVP